MITIPAWLAVLVLLVVVAQGIALPFLALRVRELADDWTAVSATVSGLQSWWNRLDQRRLPFHSDRPRRPERHLVPVPSPEDRRIPS